MNIENIGDYYLVLTELKNLSEQERDYIHGYYKDMLGYSQDPNSRGMSLSIFNTLDVGGYIKSRTQEDREKKLDYICG